MATDSLPGQLLVQYHGTGALIYEGAAIVAEVKERDTAHELVRRFNAFVDLAEPDNVLITTPEKWQALNDKNAAFVTVLRMVGEYTGEGRMPANEWRALVRMLGESARAALHDAGEV